MPDFWEPWPVPTKDPPPEEPERVTLREWIERRIRA